MPACVPEKSHSDTLQLRSATQKGGHDDVEEIDPSNKSSVKNG